MIFGGLRPCSFIDFPGRVAVVAFTQGCNLRCRYCHNPALVAGPPPLRVAPDEVLALLARRRGKLHGLVVSGGEPTLQPELAPFLAEVKAMGFAVKLDTNGTRPEVIEALLAARLVDFLAVDLKATPAASGWLCGSGDQPLAARRCLDLALSAGVEHEVRTTVASPVHTAAELDALAATIEGASRWSLQRFRPGDHLDPEAGLSPPPAALLEAACASARRRGIRATVR